VGEVLLTGGGSQMKGLSSGLSERFGRSTEIWNPLSEIEIKGSNLDEATLASVGPRMAVAVGLASRITSGKLS